MKDYEKLMTEMPRIAELVKKFPENLQKEAYQRLLSELTGEVPDPRSKDAERNATRESHSGGGAGLSICAVRDGGYHFTVRDLKARSAADATKRLIYVLIYSYVNAMGVDDVSRKQVINPHLQSWRLNDGNTRRFIVSDPGIIKNGDKLSLDIHAESEAKKFIDEIKDEEAKGAWHPSAKKRVSSKEK